MQFKTQFQMIIEARFVDLAWIWPFTFLCEYDSRRSLFEPNSGLLGACRRISHRRVECCAARNESLPNTTMQGHPTNATQAKDRHYMQLGNSLSRLSRAVGQTADLCEMLKVNLDSMKLLAACHAAQ